MKLSVVASFDFPDHKQWDLMNGERVEGQITWFGPTHELVEREGLEVGFHLDMVDWCEEAQRECLCIDVGVFRSFYEAFERAQEVLR